MTTTSEYRAAAGHDHVFLGQNHERNERRVWMVIALTAAMMVAEIVAGHWYGSMALTADGWHMSTHAGAMLISALAYLYARREARNPRFTFGTGKFGDLAGFASAIVLAVVALLIAVESGMRLVSPVEIDFNQAILVAIIGLSAKNAILIIEFAKDLRAEGKSTYDATVEAAHLRFRPILMTSLAFSLGVLPMAIASGASAASQNAIGTGVLGGMISATILAIFFVPVFFVFVMKIFGDRKKENEIAADAVSPAE